MKRGGKKLLEIISGNRTDSTASSEERKNDKNKRNHEDDGRSISNGEEIFPAELILHILSQLDDRSLATLPPLSKRWIGIAREEMFRRTSPFARKFQEIFFQWMKESGIWNQRAPDPDKLLKGPRISAELRLKWIEFFLQEQHSLSESSMNFLEFAHGTGRFLPTTASIIFQWLQKLSLKEEVESLLNGTMALCGAEDKTVSVLAFNTLSAVFEKLTEEQSKPVFSKIMKACESVNTTAWLAMAAIFRKLTKEQKEEVVSKVMVSCKKKKNRQSYSIYFEMEFSGKIFKDLTEPQKNQIFIQFIQPHCDMGISCAGLLDEISSHLTQAQNKIVFDKILEALSTQATREAASKRSASRWTRSDGKKIKAVLRNFVRIASHFTEEQALAALPSIMKYIKDDRYIVEAEEALWKVLGRIFGSLKPEQNKQILVALRALPQKTAREEENTAQRCLEAFFSHLSSSLVVPTLFEILEASKDASSAASVEHSKTNVIVLKAWNRFSGASKSAEIHSVFEWLMNQCRSKYSDVECKAEIELDLTRFYEFFKKFTFPEDQKVLSKIIESLRENDTPWHMGCKLVGEILRHSKSPEQIESVFVEIRLFFKKNRHDFRQFQEGVVAFCKTFSRLNQGQCRLLLPFVRTCVKENSSKTDRFIAAQAVSRMQVGLTEEDSKELIQRTHWMKKKKRIRSTDWMLMSKIFQHLNTKQKGKVVKQISKKMGPSKKTFPEALKTLREIFPHSTSHQKGMIFSKLSEFTDEFEKKEAVSGEEIKARTSLVKTSVGFFPDLTSLQKLDLFPRLFNLTSKSGALEISVLKMLTRDIFDSFTLDQKDALFRRIKEGSRRAQNSAFLLEQDFPTVSSEEKLKEQYAFQCAVFQALSTLFPCLTKSQEKIACDITLGIILQVADFSNRKKIQKVALQALEQFFRDTPPAPSDQFLYLFHMVKELLKSHELHKMPFGLVYSLFNGMRQIFPYLTSQNAKEMVSVLIDLSREDYFLTKEAGKTLDAIFMHLTPEQRKEIFPEVIAFLNKKDQWPRQMARDCVFNVISYHWNEPELYRKQIVLRSKKIVPFGFHLRRLNEIKLKAIPQPSEQPRESKPSSPKKKPRG